MKLTRTGMKVQEQDGLGVFLWMLPNGNYLADTNERMLSLNGFRGDITAMAKMAKAARECGYPDGQAVWQKALQCTDEEYEEQVAEMLEGRTPDARLRRE
ncbi:hypothetical protein SEA_NICEHOUSE_56 [Rhodococcus phage NiceHouse]|nr:hypothetical protein SEA_NICEHOUSE_56 [Rhodococcus phage NiceHouse]